MACQWEQKRAERFQGLPADLRIPADVHVDAGVPKLHCKAHKLMCQLVYLLALIVGMGRMDGEGIERIWAFINGCTGSTKEMGSGHRHDTIDCHFSYLNWCKYVLFGTFDSVSIRNRRLISIAIGITLLKRRKQARFEKARQTAVHDAFTTIIPDDILGEEDIVVKWTAEVEAWEKDRRNVERPYGKVVARTFFF